jgi:serine/threonine protein kinase
VCLVVVWFLGLGAPLVTRSNSQADNVQAKEKAAAAAFTSLNRLPALVAAPFWYMEIRSADLIQDFGVASMKGSFGEVSKCTWKGTPVAVKKFMNVADVQKFYQEARMMHSISHPNCVRLYGVCAPPDAALVMEWMGGGDLNQFLSQRPLPELYRRLLLFRQVCAGLNSLHSDSPDPIIHTDLKPANIMLDSDAKIAKIADFGLSKLKMASYAGSNAVGTILYFAPEMLLCGVPSDRPTDIYAMGLILWEMLSGIPVWHNADGSPFRPFQLMAKYNRRERPSLDELPLGLDPAVIALMQDCWAEDPAQRPTADQLWRRMSALDANNPEHNNQLQLYSDGFSPSCGTLEDRLRLAVPSLQVRHLSPLAAVAHALALQAAVKHPAAVRTYAINRTRHFLF